MNTVFTILTFFVVLALLGVAAWVFVVAPFSVPRRH